MAHTVREGPLITKTAKMFIEATFESLRQTSSAHKRLSLNRQTRSKTEPTSSPFHFVQFLAQHVRCNMEAQGYLCHLPILEVARDFVTGSTPHCSRCLPVFRSLTSALQLWDQKAIPDERVEGLAVWHKCWLLSESKRREAHHAAACWAQPESAA